MKSNKPKNRTRKADFSNKVRVRNVYETFNPETGTLNVNLNEYNANADLEHSELFGYPIMHPSFVPHSKSSLVRAGRFMGNNSGWQSALSSVGNYTTNQMASQKNRNNMRAYFGNKWEEATALVNTTEREIEQAKNAAKESFNNSISDLESAFFTKTGVISPSALSRITKEKVTVIEADYASRLITKPNAVALIKKIKDDAQKITESMPSEDRDKYMKDWLNLKNKLIREQKEADKLMKSYTTFGRGNPYPVVQNKSLKNRLRNAIERARVNTKNNTFRAYNNRL